MTVFDKNEAPGGLLRYGIPNFKLHKPDVYKRQDKVRFGMRDFECIYLFGNVRKQVIVW